MGHAYRYMLLVTIYVREVFENLSSRYGANKSGPRKVQGLILTMSQVLGLFIYFILKLDHSSGSLEKLGSLL